MLKEGDQVVLLGSADVLAAESKQTVVQEDVKDKKNNVQEQQQQQLQQQQQQQHQQQHHPPQHQQQHQSQHHHQQQLDSKPKPKSQPYYPHGPSTFINAFSADNDRSLSQRLNSCILC